MKFRASSIISAPGTLKPQNLLVGNRALISLFNRARSQAFLFDRKFNRPPTSVAAPSTSRVSVKLREELSESGLGRNRVPRRQLVPIDLSIGATLAGRNPGQNSVCFRAGHRSLEADESIYHGARFAHSAPRESGFR